MTLDFDVDRFRDGAAELDDLHHESIGSMRADVQELHAETRKAVGGASRRQFLIRAGLATTAVTIGSQVVPLKALWSPAFAQALTDGDIAAFAASVEYAAVAAYKAAAASGKVTTKAIADAAAEFAGHHQEHGDAFFGASGGKATKDPNKALITQLGQELMQARSEMDVVKLAYNVENAAAATYQFGLGALQSVAAKKLAASILPVEAGHAAVLGQVLYAGDPSKDGTWLPSFQTETGALNPSTLPAK